MITSVTPALAFLLNNVFLLSVPYNKQLNYLDCSVITGKSQTSTYLVDFVITHSRPQFESFTVMTSLY